MTNIPELVNALRELRGPHVWEAATALEQQAAEIARMAAEIKILRESLVQVLDHFLNGDHSRVLDLANAALNFSPPATAAKPNSPDTPTQPDEIPLRSTDRS